MGRTVIVAYRPMANRAADLEALVRDHVPTLQTLGLATARPPTLMKAQDGTIVEVFTVQDLWRRFGDCCDYLPIGSIPDAAQPFSEFEAL